MDTEKASFDEEGKWQAQKAFLEVWDHENDSLGTEGTS